MRTGREVARPSADRRMAAMTALEVRANLRLLVRFVKRECVSEENRIPRGLFAQQTSNEWT